MRQLEQQMTVSGNSPHTLTFPEAAAQSFEVGEPVVLDAAGAVTVAATGAASVVGVAAMPATTVAGRPVTVWIANDDTLFGVVMPGAVQADIKKLVTLNKAAGVWTADRATAGTFLVMEIQTRPNGQKIARGKFLESATQLGKAA